MKLEYKLIISFLVAVLISGLTGYLGASYLAMATIPLVLFLAFILAGSWGIIFSHYIMRQLNVFRRVISDISEGSLNKRIIVRGKDEIGELAYKFNEMVTRLQEAHEILEKKVRERTREIDILKTSLEAKVKERTAQLEALKTSLEKTVEERTHELHEKIQVLEQLNKAMVGRELRMIELKKEIEDLKKNG